ncbi:hypothetical protein GCM10025873_10590 [Demequina sediminis]|nr:hypothetical protein GCM10025873_10590 [Demequina sediminis]
MPVPMGWSESTPIDSLSDLFDISEVVVHGTIEQAFVRDTGVWSEAAGPGDTAIFSEDIVLVVSPVGGGEQVEVRFEHLYDNSEGGQPVDPAELEFPEGPYVFSLREDAQHGDVVEGGPTPYRCATLSTLCVLEIAAGDLVTAPREDLPAAPASAELGEDATGVTVDGIGAVAREAGADPLGF